MIKYTIVCFLIFSALSCKAQSNIEMHPQILISSSYDEIEKALYPIIVINNNSDSLPYAGYDIWVNVFYKAKLLNRPKIDQGNGIEIPLDVFFDEAGNQFKEGDEIRIVTFSAKGYDEYTEEYEYKITFDLIGQLNTRTKDKEHTVVVDMILEYDSNDSASETELLGRVNQLRDFTRNYFANKYYSELNSQNEEGLKLEIKEILNTKYLDIAEVSDVVFRKLEVMDF